MAEITLQGNLIHTCGELPAVGSNAPDFTLTKTDLVDVSLQDYRGKKIVLNIFPSIDTSVCAASVRKFNEEVQQLENTVVLCVSLDLPFAHGRFCGAEGLEDVIPVSELHERGFGEDYGVRIVDGALKGLLARAVVAIDEKGTVLYTEQVPEIAQEPNYAAALQTLA
ncbi:lipid hydroperoxide peroxidase [candidate division KSB3 bacterium]|uniref:Thiol peroxidase n=1 Tax=candidate division KSB3 bacterium TaxID=2044937 RepID=A0A2G6E779_9BACT|nr:MAG: lipid hydroperoxide peroxidase [candidate division KSB3 bacterium]PIE30202.1 MAG: lipid hydroperoxide peroxidase [candidate division KSB3 bacterium]